MSRCWIVVIVSLLAVPLAAQSDLELEKVTSAATVHSGDLVSYTVTITNHGPATAANVQWTDTLLANLDFDSLATPPAGWSCTTPPGTFGGGGTVTCTRASFGVTSDTFTLVLRVRSTTPGGTVVTNEATVSATTSDPNPSNNTGSDSIVTTIEADLAIQKNHTPVTPGSNFDYIIDVSNFGPSDGASLTMTDVLSPWTTFVAISGGWSCITPAVGSSGTVTCTAPSINALGASTITLTVNLSLLPANTTVSNTVSISAASPDDNLVNNSETTSFIAGVDSDRSIAIADSPDPVAPGGTLTYVVTATNSGPDAASNASMAVSLASNTLFSSLSAPAGWSCTTPAIGASGTIDCQIASFVVGTVQFTITTTVAAGAADSSILATNATIDAEPVDSAPGNESASATTTVSAAITSNVPFLSPLGMIALVALLGMAAFLALGR